MGDDRDYFRIVLGKLADGLDEFKQRGFRLSFHCLPPLQLDY